MVRILDFFVTEEHMNCELDRKSRMWSILYEFFMALLAVAVVTSLVLEKRFDLPDGEIAFLSELDFVIWLVFVIDYAVRFAMTDNKKKFFKQNIIDLISIIPFEVMFQGLRAARIIRVIYMLRCFVYLNRIYKNINGILTTNNFHHVLWFTFSIIFCGAIAISCIDDMSIGDALWWSFVTTTTVGYGDIAPASFGGRIVAIFLMVFGIGFLSTLTGNISSHFISNQNRKATYKHSAIGQIITELNDFDNMTIDDIDNVHNVLIALKQNDNKK